MLVPLKQAEEGDHMSVKEQAKIILRDVGKGLATIISPPSKDDKPSETLTLHYCEKCKKYHRAE